MLSELRLSYDLTYMWNLKKLNSQKQWIGGCQGLGSRGNGEVSIKGNKHPVLNSGDLTHSTMTTGFSDGSAIKNPSAIQETQVQSLGQEDSLK